MGECWYGTPWASRAVRALTRLCGVLSPSSSTIIMGKAAATIPAPCLGCLPTSQLLSPYFTQPKPGPVIVMRISVANHPHPSHSRLPSPSPSLPLTSPHLPSPPQAGQCGRCRNGPVRALVCEHCRLDERFIQWEVGEHCDRRGGGEGQGAWAMMRCAAVEESDTLTKRTE